MGAVAALATWNSEFYANRAFDPLAIAAMRPSLQSMALPWLYAYRLLREHDIDLVTADCVRDPATTHLLAYDWTPDAERLIAHGARPTLLVSFEPPVIAWWLYANLPRVSAQFATTLWFEGTRARCRGHFERLLFPVGCSTVAPAQVSWSQRRLLVMVNSNKVLARPGDLPRWFDRPREVSVKRILAMLRHRAIANDRYRVRFEAIAGLSELDLYGEGWQRRHPGVNRELHETALRAYRGPTSDKAATMAQYRFALAIENTRFAGYISEKLLDCFVAGTIPVYDGAPDVARYVPAAAFVDARQFASWSELEGYLRGLSEVDARRYLEAGQEFLQSRQFRDGFCAESFARQILAAINNQSA